jgi:crotonobetainyl-CoA:carnitine CoA-transferase CaiB-like acyl-CoA transferase
MLPLEGIKVLDLSKIGPGPFCTMILGDLGTEILKVETPLDEFYQTTSQTDGEIYSSLNRNKKSIAIDLKVREGRKIFYKLTETADVIVEGFRPGVVKRLGVDYQTISRKNPRIIYCSISGYGQTGPYSKLPGHDVNFLSLSGALSLITDKDGKPIVPLNLVGDFAGGALYAAIGIITALFVREKLGKGQYIDIGITNGVMSLLTMFFDYYFSTGKLPESSKSSASGYYPYYRVYETKDRKYLSIGCTEPWFWERLCKVIGKVDFVPFQFSPKHIFEVENSEKFSEILEYFRKIFLTKTRDEWFELLAGEDIPVGKVYSLSEVASDPYLKNQEMIVEIDHPIKGKIRQIGIPIKLSKTKGKIRSLAPRFGEHKEEILRKLGYRVNEIKKFTEAGIVQ